MLRTLAILLLLGGAVGAEPAPPPDPVQWAIDFTYDRGALHSRIGIAWTRSPAQTTATLVLRRPIDPGAPNVDDHPHRATAVERVGPALSPRFLYPTTPDRYHAAYDARSHALPPGAHVGEWTVVASVDRDPQGPIFDDVEPDTPYVYALVPATRADAPDTFASFGEAAVITQPVTADMPWLRERRWLYAAVFVLVVAVMVPGARSWRRRRRNRAGM